MGTCIWIKIKADYLPQCLKESHCFGFNREANRGMSAIIWPCSSSLNGYQMEAIRQSKKREIKSVLNLAITKKMFRIT
nr:hypothetical protein CFP56_40779 [Quercus suber]